MIYIPIVIAGLALARCFTLERRVRRQARRIANLTRLVKYRTKYADAFELETHS